MKHFSFLTNRQLEELFFKRPEIIDFQATQNSPLPSNERMLLAKALGATLYMPATRKDIATIILSSVHSATSYVFCLEDSIGDTQVQIAEQNLLHQLEILQKHVLTMEQPEKNTLPLLFIRVRTPEHLKNFGNKLGNLLQIIDGFSLPKAGMHNLPAYFEYLTALSEQAKTWLWALPILESKTLMKKTTRSQELNNIYELFTKPAFEERLLTIRIGITDLCGLFGIRRTSNTTIYEITLLRDFITDVLNIFLLNDRFIVSGGVWEFFQHSTNFTPISQEIENLIKEVQLDRLNGVMGKTCIHPTHILPINSQLVVSKEDYLDAKQIISPINRQIGVFKSEMGNKMNERKPHLLWAKKMLNQATIYGVYHTEKSYHDLLAIANTNREKSACTINNTQSHKA